MNLKAKLDKIFSTFIRMRDAKDGICICISCGKRHSWKLMDAGHFVNRRYMALRYSETNCNAQCRSCNRFDEGNPVGYMEGLKAKYGEDIIDRLMIAKKTSVKHTKFEFETMIGYYKRKVWELE
jgi:hypothetical protein